MENNLHEYGYTQNRELSWLNFNDRILEEACDETVPLFERLNFIAIFTSNLDEFFQVRVGELLNDDMDIEDKVDVRSGMDASEQLEAIHLRIAELIDKRDVILADILNKLKYQGVCLARVDELNDDENAFLAHYYLTEIKPILKPIISESPDDIPSLEAGDICIIAKLHSDTSDKYGIVEIPRILNHTIPLVPVLTHSTYLKFCLTTDLIASALPDLFYPFKITESTCIRINRNADVELNNYASNKIAEMRKLIAKRSVADPDTLYIEGGVSSNLRGYILDAFSLYYKQSFTTTTVSTEFISEIGNQLSDVLREVVCYPHFEPIDQLLLSHKSLFDTLRERDIVSIYPYDSMQVLLTLLKEASENPKVSEIRITIYRLASNPRIIDYLINAARNGIRVRVLMELRARFDEESNVDWAEKLEQAGCKVYFGNDNYKVHTKLFQVVYKHDGEKRYITQFGTGNYNEKTAKLYTDISLVTMNQRLGRDASKLFKDIFKNQLGVYDYLLASPKTMRISLIQMIDAEAAKGADGYIFIKCNSVTDTPLIEALMRASCKGCKIKMNVRGICCLLPGVPGYTENIEIVSVVGRFLEHSRVYVFGRGREERMYISSADFMTRNMIKRIEVACPVYNIHDRNRIRNVLELNFNDNVKGRRLKPDGSYGVNNPNSPQIDSQKELMKHRF